MSCAWVGFPQAEEAHLEALRIREDYFGPDHDTVAQSAQMLSLLLQSSGEKMKRPRVGAVKLDPDSVYTCGTQEAG